MGKRIEYIDAMRGFTMFLVVLVHTVPRYFLYDVSSGPLIYNTIIAKFRMPLFFFVSGFVFFKAERKWDAATVWSFIKKKIPVQIVTPVIFMLLYFLMSNIDLHEGLVDVNKRGYWFTYTLFEFFIFYILTSIVLDIIHLREGGWRDITILAVSFMIFLTSFNTVNQHLCLSDNTKGFMGMEQFSRYPFFVLGVVAHKYFPLFERLLDKSSAVISNALAFVALNIISFKYQPGIYAVTVAEDFILALTGIFLIFYLFRNLKCALSQDTRVGRMMQYVGKHTLDIYLIHYFVLFFFYKLLELIAPLIREAGDWQGRIYLTAIDFIAAALVVSCCLLISKFIRIVPFVNYWMFGAKKSA